MERNGAFTRPPGSGTAAPQPLMKHFVRTPDGDWLCTMPAELQTAQGRIQVTTGTRISRGKLFMGLELARILDEQAEKGALRD
jgi:hypothetical protein